MLISFELTMPSNNSWNGRWSGQENKYYIIKSFTAKAKDHIKDMMNKSNYYTYSFGDGWVAAVELEEIDGREAAKRRKLSKGFCGYDWMIESIINNGLISPKLF